MEANASKRARLLLRGAVVCSTVVLSVITAACSSDSSAKDDQEQKAADISINPVARPRVGTVGIPLLFISGTFIHLEQMDPWMRTHWRLGARTLRDLR